SNIKVPLGPLKYLFNNPQMHIWHHAKNMPRRYGANFGISLSVWDYIFKTQYVPSEGRDEPLGFEGVDKFPDKFSDQIFYGFKNKLKRH
ncbi:MAG: sterol desaturase family protein, partial [Nitrososphaeraceae archaeon]|nr:sterol desaturase family protein [Nitrososphaeraceae archaeon]